MRDLIPPQRPALALAPMQAITDLSFMRVLARRGAPDWWVTEYIRVHPESILPAEHRRLIAQIPGNRPLMVQLIGNDEPSLLRTIRLLDGLPIAGIDLNLGCPAPIVCRKHAGGGLLRDPARIDRLLATLRAAIPGRFTVKTRLGYHHPDEWPGLLAVFRRHQLDGLTVHARSVLERYQTPVHPDCVRLAVDAMDCPVIANGNAVDVATAQSLLDQSGAAGLMIGRGAIRNPWIFAQLRATFNGRTPVQVTHRDLWEYLLELYDDLAGETRRFHPKAHVQRMKKTMAYITHGLEGPLEYQMRRATQPEEFFAIVAAHLDHDTPLPPRPPVDSALFCGFDDLLPMASPQL